MAALFTAGADAAPGDADPAFGTAGIALSDTVTGEQWRASAIAVQPDGGIVLGISNGASRHGLARLTASGAIDVTFGNGGAAIKEENAIINALVIQPDGKLLVNVHGVMALDRYTASGAVDTAFGVNGRTPNLTLGSPSPDVAGLALQADGRIVTAGSTLSVYDFALARYLDNGAPETDFGAGGLVTTDINGNDIALALAIQPDGKIIVAGQVNAMTNSSDFGVVRYGADGTLDTSFGVGGKVTVDFGGGDSAYAAAIQPDGNIVLAGATMNISTGIDIALVRLNADGAPDTGFGSGGKIAANLGAIEEVPTALALQPDGKLLVAVSDTLGDLKIARFTAAGALDATFGSGGVLTTDVGGTSDRARSLALQPDGKILVAGDAGGAGTTVFAVARYQGDAVDLTPDPVSFPGVTNQDLGATVTTALATVSGLTPGVAVPVSIQNGEYALDGSAAYSSGSGWVRNGNKISIRQIAAATTDTDKQSTLIVGGLRTANNAALVPGATAMTVSSRTHRSPVAVDDNASTPSNTAVVVPVLINDSDADGDALSIGAFATASSHAGTVVNNGDGTLTYTPAGGYTGADSFTYTVSDGRGGSATATVAVTVNDPPVALDLAIRADRGAAVDGVLSASDANSDLLTFALVTNGAQGHVEITDAATGAFTYTPNAGATGSDAFTYMANDGTANSNVATVTVTLPPASTAATVEDGSGGGGGMDTSLLLLLGAALLARARIIPVKARGRGERCA